jgi:hypothetical protein
MEIFIRNDARLIPLTMYSKAKKTGNVITTTRTALRLSAFFFVAGAYTLRGSSDGIMQDLSPQGLANATYVSDYIFRGLKDSHNSIQDNFEEQFKKVFTIGVWNNNPLVRDFGSEIDVYSSYSYLINNLVAVDAESTYFWYTEAHRSRGQTRRSLEFGIGPTFSLKGYKEAVHVYRNTTLDAWTAENVFSYEYEMIPATLDVTLEARVGIVSADRFLPENPNANQAVSYRYGSAGVVVSRRVGKHSSISVSGFFGSTSGYTDEEKFGGYVGGRRAWASIGATTQF